MIPLFIAIAAAFIGLLHLVIYEVSTVILGITLGWPLWIFRAVFIILGLSFITASLFSNFRNNVFSRALYKASAVWIGFGVYLFLASTVYGLVVGIACFIVPGTLFIFFGRSLFITALATTIYGVIHARKIYLTEVSVKLNNLPEYWNGKTAVLVSDLHLGQIRGKRFAEKIALMIRNTKPEIVFITGDLYDGVKVDAADIISPLSGLRPPRGIFFVTGNHEEFRDCGPFLDAIRKASIRVLMNESVNIDGLQLIGVDDRDSTNRTAFEEILDGIHIDKDKPSILLKHQPDLLDVAEKHGISLQLSGHTHKAQMYPLSYITKWIYRGRDYGLHQLGGMQIYTSSGVGTWGPPLRVGTRAEVVKIKFEN